MSTHYVQRVGRILLSILLLVSVACSSSSSSSGADGQGTDVAGGDTGSALDASPDLGGMLDDSSSSDAQQSDLGLDASSLIDVVPDSGAPDLAVAPDLESDAPTADTSATYLDPQSLTSEVELLASDEFDGREPGTEGWKKAQAYLIGRLSACGLTPAGTDGYRQPVTTGIGVNLLARVDGTDPTLKARVVLLSAHYDHIGDCAGFICNGALDNAAAVTAVVAVGCSLVATPPKRSVLIALWDTEEPPTFLTDKMGSQFFAANPTVPLAQIDVAIVLDLYGGNFWGADKSHLLFGAELSAELRAALDQTQVPTGIVPRRLGLHTIEEWYYGHEAWSDYDAFRNRNVPFLFISDGINKDYHTANDEVSHLDLPKLAVEASYLHAIVTRLANAAQTPTFDAKGSDYLRDAQEILALYDAVLAPNSGLVDTLGLSSTSVSYLLADKAAVEKTKAVLEGGATATKAQITSLRTAVQRILCYAGSIYAENQCNI